MSKLQLSGRFLVCLTFLFVFILCTQAITPHYYELDKSHVTFENKTMELPKNAASLQSNFLIDKSAPWKFHSQAKQDCTINSLFNDKNGGYFVDLAANDWSELSNSLMLEYYNDWRGVCIEPNPIYLEGLLSNRKCAVYVNPTSSTTGETVKFSFKGVAGGIVGNEFDNKEGSTKGLTELVTVTLTSILDHAKAPSVIDYFSLDVEGAEYHVLSSFAFDRYTFLTITIERPSNKIHRLLAEHGYRFVNELATFGDCLYIHHTLPNFVEYMNKHHNTTVHAKEWASEGISVENRDYLKHPKWDGVYKQINGTHSHVHVQQQ
jgi:FkbM family methyltransferase